MMIIVKPPRYDHRGLSISQYCPSLDSAQFLLLTVKESREHLVHNLTSDRDGEKKVGEAQN